jgi:hypothetical protein
VLDPAAPVNVEDIVSAEPVPVARPPVTGTSVLLALIEVPELYWVFAPVWEYAELCKLLYVTLPEVGSIAISPKESELSTEMVARAWEAAKNNRLIPRKVDARQREVLITYLMAQGEGVKETAK